MTHRDPVIAIHRRHRFPAEIIAHAVWLYFRFPNSLQMVEDMLAAPVSQKQALLSVGSPPTIKPMMA